MRIKWTTPAGYHYAPHLLDLIKDNHCLIAGTTGAGKSVLENSIINALLCTAYPGTVAGACQLVLIDPKKVELNLYKNLPHTLYYADDITGIKETLYKVRKIIDDRLRVMKRKRQRKSTDGVIYVIIDELVDIVTHKTEGKEITSILTDCASISRACNVFFVALTQSPARLIIPAQFKLLFNCRVALRCNSVIESRQIIDTPEAVELPQHGQAIVIKNIEKYKIVVPLTPDEQLETLVRFWEKQHPIISKLMKPR